MPLPITTIVYTAGEIPSAAKLNDTNQCGEAALTPGANIADGGSRVRRRGPVVVLDLVFIPSAAIGAGATLMTIPVGYRPTGTVNFVGLILGGGPVFLQASPSGVVNSAGNIASGANVYANATLAL